MPEKTQARTGGETAPERFLDRHLGNVVHLFLTLLAVLILVAAAIATAEIIVRDFPQLWRAASEYEALHAIIQNLLLVFHRRFGIFLDLFINKPGERTGKQRF